MNSYSANEKNLGRGFEIKKIEKVLAQDFLSAKQIELAQFIADYYFSSLRIVLKSFAPQITMVRNLKKVANPSEKKNIILYAAYFGNLHFLFLGIGYSSDVEGEEAAVSLVPSVR